MAEYKYYELSGGYKLCAALHENRRHPEIFGHVEKPDGSVIKGSAGWWRTTDMEVAKAAAEEFWVQRET